jgi:hypothetical protein
MAQASGQVHQSSQLIDLAKVYLVPAHGLFRQIAAGQIPQHHLERDETLVIDCQCHDLHVRRMAVQSNNFIFLKFFTLSAID